MKFHELVFQSTRRSLTASTFKVYEKKKFKNARVIIKEIHNSTISQKVGIQYLYSKPLT